MFRERGEYSSMMQTNPSRIIGPSSTLAEAHPASPPEAHPALDVDTWECVQYWPTITISNSDSSEAFTQQTI